MAKKYRAQCACGAVKFEFDKDPDFVADCHCLDCKKASGGEMATFFAVPQDDFTLISGNPKKRHCIAESGKGRECGLPCDRQARARSADHARQVDAR
jgi:hypothetical protein